MANVTAHCALSTAHPLLQFRRRDLLCDEGFDDVADLVIVETFDGDTAFVSLLHFADVFFEAAEAADVAFEDDYVVADQAGMRRAFDRPVRHHAAGDGADLRHADFGLADDGLFGRGLHQPEHRVADLFFHFIDDRMQPDVDVLLFGRVVGAGFGSHVEPDDHRRRAGLGGVGRAGEQHVVVGDRADARADDADFDLLGREFGQRVLEHLDGALDVGLENDQQFFDLAGFHLHGELVEPPGGGARQSHRAGLRLAKLADLLRLGDVVDDLELVAGGGNAFKTEHLYGRGRGRLLHALAEVVHQRADLAEVIAGDEGVADAQRAVLNQHRRDRTSPAVQLRFEHSARRFAPGVRLQVENVRRQQDHFEQALDVVLHFRRDLDHGRVAAPAVPEQPAVGQFFLHAVGVGVRFIDLVDRDDYRDLGRFRVVNRLDRLRHHPVVCGDHQHDDVSDAGAARAHHREGFVTGRVEKDHAAHLGRIVRIRHVDRISPDVLRNPARLAFGHARLADGVE